MSAPNPPDDDWIDDPQRRLPGPATALVARLQAMLDECLAAIGEERIDDT